MDTDNLKDWLIPWLVRVLKGVFMGAAFIVPGISGGAIAAAMGIYERMIKFMANPFKNFWDNFFFFFPVGMGAVFGVFVFALFINFFFDIAHAQLIWFFIGCIAGTLPSLWRQAGSRKRSAVHIVILVLTFAGALLFLQYTYHAIGGEIPLNIYTWAMAGAIIALGSIIPGFSSANILIFLHMYMPMTLGITAINFWIIIPMGIGLVLGILLFSKVIAFIIDKAYSSFFHGVLGFVIASSILIIPLDYNYVGLGGLLCLVTALSGVFLGNWICKL